MIYRKLLRAVFLIPLTIAYMFAHASAMHDAADKGDIDTIIKQHTKGVDLNFKNDFGMTALHFAAYGGHIAVIDYLLKNNVDVNIQNTTGYTPLTLAIDAGHIEVARRLVAHGADININVDTKDPIRVEADGKTSYKTHRSTALSIAWDKEDRKTVAWLVSIGANVNVRLLSTTTPKFRICSNKPVTRLFHKVVASNDYATVKLFLEKGADINTTEYYCEDSIPLRHRPYAIGLLQMTDATNIKQLLRRHGAKEHRPISDMHDGWSGFWSVHRVRDPSK